jgi:hypothetical protein
MGNAPVSGGIVASLSHPGGNLTGVTLFSAELGAKRVQLMQELVPDNTVIGLLENPKNPNLPKFMKSLREAVQAGSQRLLVVHATNDGELQAAFETFAFLYLGSWSYFRLLRRDSSLRNRWSGSWLREPRKVGRISLLPLTQVWRRRAT